jgi:hypothetical protein
VAPTDDRVGRGASPGGSGEGSAVGCDMPSASCTGTVLATSTATGSAAWAATESSLGPTIGRRPGAVKHDRVAQHHGERSPRVVVLGTFAGFGGL